MKTKVLIALFLCALLYGGEKKSPRGQAGDETVTIRATLLSSEQVRQAVGSDFDNNYTVLDVRVEPRGGKPYPLQLDDFILRSESSGEHSGPFLVASQIAGSTALVVKRTYGNKANPNSPRVIESTKVEMKDNGKPDPALDALKQKMLANSTVSESVSGLLFFPLTKEKAKSLILSYQTPQSKLRLSFR